MPKTKRCFKCGRRRPFERFYDHPFMADGKLGKCDDCTKRDVALNIKRKRRDPEWIAKERARWVEKARRLQPGYDKKWPEKVAARRTLSNAVQRGKVVKPNACSACGKRCNPDGHHEDYAKPLDVLWLCRRCHLAAHGRIRKESNSF